MNALSATNLTALDPRVVVPDYDRAGASAGIVHFGVGAFHRAHQAVYLDDVLAGGGSEWGICGVGVLPHDRRIADVLQAQDGLYTLMTVDSDDTTVVRVIGSHLGHLHAPDNPAAVLEALADPATKIVSLTITEGGYSINDATGEFEPTDPAVLADLAGAEVPSSVLGFIVAGLAARRAAGSAPFTVMCCDNIQHNGHVTRTAITGFAARLDPDLAGWIGEHVAFPNSMVDRITPATTPEVAAAVAAYGIEDGWPVRAEAFTQWVLEDNFPAGRPPLETVGVQIVPDVMPYELMKLRLLNASHQLMAYLGVLSGYTYAHEVCRDADFVAYLLDYMHTEAIPTLAPVPGIDLDAYCDQLIDRFSSEAIRDTLARLALDGSDRIPKFVLPVVEAQLATGGDIRRATLALAAWSRYLDPATDLAGPAPVDRRLESLRIAASRENEQPGSFLDQAEIFGDLGQHPVLRAAFLDARTQLAEIGARAAVTALS